MALTGLKLLLNIILNDNDSKNEILSYPMKGIIIKYNNLYFNNHSEIIIIIFF